MIIPPPLQHTPTGKCNSWWGAFKFREVEKVGCVNARCAIPPPPLFFHH